MARFPIGLCRAFEEATQCKCIAIDRVHPQTNLKCDTAILLDNGHIWMPIFTPTGDIEFHDYCIHIPLAIRGGVLDPPIL